MNILLVGSPGAGKSTVIRRVIEKSGLQTSGFLTLKDEHRIDENKGCPVYFSAINGGMSGNRKLIGYSKSGKLESYKEVFDEIAENMDKIISGGELIVLDEIGVLEKVSEKYMKSIMEILNGEVPVIAAVKQKDSSFLCQVRNHPKSKCYYISEENREEISQRIIQLLDEQRLF